MNENVPNRVDEYFQKMENCFFIECRKVIFDTDTKREWFFEDGYWCYFDFACEYNDYALRKVEDKEFLGNYVIRDMSYEIKMLLAYTILRGIVTIEKEDFTSYVFKFENARKITPDLTVEKFNYDLREKEQEALRKSDKITNFILSGCLFMIGIVAAIFIIAVVIYIKKSI